jgi:hypothetical protein
MDLEGKVQLKIPKKAYRHCAAAAKKRGCLRATQNAERGQGGELEKRGDEEEDTSIY